MTDPKYLKIFKDIEKKIINAELKPGEMISSETVLCKEYGVSRATVRKSIAILVNEGFIYSIPGKGHIVQEPQHNKYTVYYDEMKNSINNVDKTKLLEVNIILPDEKLANELQITKNKNVIKIRRLFYTDGEPVAYDIKYLLYYKGMPNVEKEIEYSTFPEMMVKGMPVFSLKKKLAIYAKIPNDIIKRYLNICNEVALLVIEQKLYDKDNKPIGLGVTSFRGDYIKLLGYGE